MRMELDKYSKKHEVVYKHRDTDPKISRCKCDGIIIIKTDYENGLAFLG
jgi:hypothetical protein